MTEDEAKTKWCPFVRVQFYPPADAQNPAVNRPECDVNCIGSNCMAWRWKERQETEREAYARGTDLRRTLQSETDGYCGLAGKE